MRPQFGKHGPQKDYRHAQVKMEWNGRILLGDIRDIYRNETRAIWLAVVTHFNGEPWPIEPPLAVLEILEIEYCNCDREDFSHWKHA